jgi:hypothetical protein
MGRKPLFNPIKVGDSEFQLFCQLDSGGGTPRV